MNLRSWLRRVPQPVKVRLDGKKVVRVGEGKNKWRDVLDVIEGCQCRGLCEGIQIKRLPDFF